jgi:hypothetical protein
LPLAGEADILRAVMASSGAVTGADGFGGLSIRGGAENQNLILFDGIPVYCANHAFGLFSIFNSSVIKSARIYKGAVPAHYSGRQSSVLDIRTRSGNYREFAGNLSLGLFTGRASLEDPIIKDKASFLVSARRTFVDPWIGAATRTINENSGKQGQTNFYFYDINAKLNFSLGDHSKVHFSYYIGRDNYVSDVTSPTENEMFLFTDRDQVNWETYNRLASVQMNSRLSRKLFVNTNIYRSEYSFESFDHDRLETFDKSSGNFKSASYNAGLHRSSIEDYGAILEFDWIPSEKMDFKFGGNYTYHIFNPSMLLTDQADSIRPPEIPLTASDLVLNIEDERITAREYTFFVSNTIKLGQYTRLNLGYNHLIIDSPNRRYNIAQPRILFNTGSKDYSFKLSWGRNGQFLHSLVNTGLGVPVNVWLPSTDRIVPEESWVFSMGHFVKSRFLGQLGL